jgi:hypothetical protein
LNHYSNTTVSIGSQASDLQDGSADCGQLHAPQQHHPTLAANMADINCEILASSAWDSFI